MFITALVIIVFISALFFYLRYLETKGIFYPLKKIEITPAILHIPFEDIYLQTKDNLKLNAWFIPKENVKSTILFCHGNAGNIGHRLEKIVLLRQADIDIFIIDYRGYGKSCGNPSEKGLYLDARAAYYYLVNRRGLNPEDIILYGESLGGAVVIDLAAVEKTGGLIVEGTFSRGRDMAKIINPCLPAFFFYHKFDSMSKIKKVSVPKLFIHSRDDEIVPFAMAKELYKEADESKHFLEIRGGHNTSFSDSQELYLAGLKLFIKGLEEKIAFDKKAKSTSKKAI